MVACFVRHPYQRSTGALDLKVGTTAFTVGLRRLCPPIGTGLQQPNHRAVISSPSYREAFVTAKVVDSVIPEHADDAQSQSNANKSRATTGAVSAYQAPPPPD
jgi:hypothetical protein